MKDHEGQETRCTLKPPLKPVSVIQYPQICTYLPVPHEGRVFMRRPDKKVVAMDEATEKIFWENEDELLGFPRTVWRGRLVSRYTRRARFAGEMLDEHAGLAPIDLQTGSIERIVPCPEPEHALTPVGGTLFYQGFDDRSRLVHALDFETGEVVWTWRGPESVHRFTSALAVDPERTYFGLDDGGVVALDQKTGRDLWRGSVADLTYNQCGPTAAEVRSLGAQGGVLVCGAHFQWVVGFRVEDGKRAWVWDCDDGIWETHGYGGLHHVLSYGGRLVTLEPVTGRVVSDYDLTRGLPKELRGAVPTSPMLVSDTHVFTGSRRGAVMAFERESGKYVWSHQPKGAAETAFGGSYFAVGNGRLYYADMSFRVYCLAEDESAETKPVPRAKGVKKPAARRPVAKKVVGVGRTKKAPRSA